MIHCEWIAGSDASTKTDGEAEMKISPVCSVNGRNAR